MLWWGYLSEGGGELRGEGSEVEGKDKTVSWGTLDKDRGVLSGFQSISEVQCMV